MIIIVDTKLQPEARNLNQQLPFVWEHLSVFKCLEHFSIFECLAKAILQVSGQKRSLN